MRCAMPSPSSSTERTSLPDRRCPVSETSLRCSGSPAAPSPASTPRSRTAVSCGPCGAPGRSSAILVSLQNPGRAGSPPSTTCPPEPCWICPQEHSRARKPSPAYCPRSGGCCTSTISPTPATIPQRSEEHTSELQSRGHLVCRLLLEKKKATDGEQIQTVT